MNTPLRAHNKYLTKVLVSAALAMLVQGQQDAYAMSAARAETGRPGVNTLHGMRIYNRVCKECHDEGKNGAPRLDDLSAWRKRIWQGEEVLDQHAIEGYVKMPAKGGHSELSNQDVIDAVHFMIIMLRDEPTR